MLPRDLIMPSPIALPVLINGRVKPPDRAGPATRLIIDMQAVILPLETETFDT